MVKMSLKKILGQVLITLPVLQTTIVEVEAVLNDRPLTFLSSTTENLSTYTSAAKELNKLFQSSTLS